MAARPTFFPAYTKHGAEQELYVVLSSDLHCSLHLRNPLGRALDGFGLYTVHELSEMYKKILAEPGFEPGAAGSRSKNANHCICRPPPQKKAELSN